LEKRKVNKRKPLLRLRREIRIGRSGAKRGFARRFDPVPGRLLFQLLIRICGLIFSKILDLVKDETPYGAA